MGRPVHATTTYRATPLKPLQGPQKTTTVYRGRRLFEDADSKGAETAEDADETNDDSERAEGSTSCPIEMDDLALDKLSDCDGEGEDFCNNCVDPARMALADAANELFENDPAAMEKAREDPEGVTTACGDALVNTMKDDGMLTKVDDALWEKIEGCAALELEDDTEECPLTAEQLDVSTDGSALHTAAKKCLDVVLPDGEEATDIDAGAYCTDCYWALLKYLMNEGAMSETFWCELKKVNATEGADLTTPEGEKVAFDAMYDDESFVACGNVMRQKILEMDLDEDGEGDQVDPLALASVAKLQKQCWSDHKPEAGTVLTDDNRRKLQELSC